MFTVLYMDLYPQQNQPSVVAWQKSDSEEDSFDRAGSNHDSLMKSRLYNLTSNLEYFDKEGKRITSTTNIRKKTPNNTKRPMVSSQPKIRLQSKPQLRQLPTLNLSSAELQRPLNVFMTDNNEFYPLKGTAGSIFTSPSLKCRQYLHLLSVLKSCNKSKEPASNPTTRSQFPTKPNNHLHKQSISNTSIFFKTRRHKSDHYHLTANPNQRSLFRSPCRPTLRLSFL